MSKRHFEHAALIVRNLLLQDCKARATASAVSFAELFQAFNPRFDKDRFWKACGL